MIPHFQLLMAIAAGILAGLGFLLVGRRLMGSAPQLDLADEPQEAPAMQPRPRITQDNLSPEAQAFIKALQSHKEPPPNPDDELVWAVDIWDARQSPGKAQGLPH